MEKDIKIYQHADFKLLDNTSDIEKSNPSVVIIEGYASMYKNADGTRYLDRDNESVSIPFLNVDNYTKNPVVVYNHDWGDVMGKCVEIRKDDKGLYVKAEIHKLTGRESAFEAVHKGLIKTFSIGFISNGYTYLDEEDAFEISSAELIEISLAPVPANADALFTVTDTKSLQVRKSLIKEQNNLSCEDMDGMCSLNTKGVTMAKNAEQEKKEEVPVVEVEKVEPEVEKEVPVVEEVKPTVTETPTESPKLSVEDLAVQIVRANEIADKARADAEAEEKLKADKAEQDKVEAEKQRGIDALEYIKERKEAIASTPVSELDVEAIEDFYEVISDTVESIDKKVIEAVTAAQDKE